VRQLPNIRPNNVDVIIRLINNSSFTKANRVYRREIVEEIQELKETPNNEDRIALLKHIISQTTIDKRRKRKSLR